MIKYNLNNINDWFYNSSDIIKVYRNNAVCYYKVTTSGGTTAQTPCYAVVDDITQYSDTEFEDVFNLADNKWYKLNNLNQYEEYGVYGSGRTSCEGSTSRLPQGYTEVEYIESNGTQYINTNAYITNTANFEVGYTISGKSHQWGYVHQNVANGAWVSVEEDKAYFGRWNSSYWVDISNQITTGNNTIVYKSNSGITVNETFNAKTLSLTSTDNITTIPLHIFGWWDFYKGGVEMQQKTQRYKSFYLKVNGVLIRDFVPAKRDSDNKYGMYDLITDTFYVSPNNVDFSGGEPITPTECVTTYEGKLTIDEEITPSPSRLPTGYTEVEYIENTGTTSSNGAYINSGLKLYDVVGNSFSLSGRVKSEYYTARGYDDLETIINSESVSSPYYGFVYRYEHSTHNVVLSTNPSNHATLSTTANTDGTTSITINCNSTSVTDQVPLGLFASYNANYSTPYRFAKATIYSLTVVKNGITVRDFVPAKRDSDSVYGLYDLITDTFYTSPNGNNFSGGSEVTPSTTATCEFIYSGNSWVNVGEISGSSITIKSPEYVGNKSSANGQIDLGVVLKDNTRFQVKLKPTKAGGGSIFGEINAPSDNDDYRFFWASSRMYYDYGNSRLNTSKSINTIYEYEIGNYYIKDLTTSTNVLTGATKSGTATSHTRNINLFLTTADITNVYYMKVFEGDTLIRDFIPWTDLNGNYGMFDKVSMQTFLPTASLSGSSNVTDVEVGGGGYEYPLEYVVREDPPNNLSFSSMTEAEAYECPWVGMSATIDGDKYVFSGDSQSGYEWVYNPSRLPVGYTEVEYVQNTSHAYLDIGFIPNQDTRIVCDMQQVTENSFPRLWGAGEWNSANGINLNYEGGYLQMSWFGKTSWTSYTSVPTNNDRHTYDLNKNYLYVDETLVGSNTYTTKTAAASIGIFCELRNNGQPPTSGNNPNYWEGEYFKGKMYSFQVYNNGTLVRDLVPCINPNNVVGTYDLVNDVFYTVPTGYTTDKLIAGNPV